MKNARLYRVESIVDGDGPYWGCPYEGPRANSAFRQMLEEHQVAWERCPAPNFKDNYIDKQHYCAFSSKRALRRWFHLHERFLLNSQGFRVKLYSVPEERVQRNHKRQVLFVRSEATHIASFPLRSF